jgi:hypothetical protein
MTAAIALPKEGQRVRVIIEGEARSVANDGFWIGSDGVDNWIKPKAEHVTYLEVLPDPAKQGDMIHDYDQIAALPELTLVIDADDGIYRKVDTLWYMPGDDLDYNPRDMYLPVEVLRLPDAK